MALHALTPFSPPAQPPPAPPLLFSLPSPSLQFLSPKTPISISLTSKPHPTIPRISAAGAGAPSSGAVDIDMVRTAGGVYAPKKNKVVVLWDLDNKPPRGPPYEAAVALKNLAARFGEIVDFAAYANRHAFVHLPQWVLEQRRERRRLDILERKGEATPPNPYICSVCGRKCKTNLDLKKHFKQLHERERQKKINRMNQLKGKKRKKYRERFVSGNLKYEEGAREILTPRVGYGLERELRRAGVVVKTVADKPQAADWAVKRQMMDSMRRGVEWMVLVSDDSDFVEMVRKARGGRVGTVVVGDWEGVLGREADVWVAWSGVERGEVAEGDLAARRRGEVGWAAEMDVGGEILVAEGGDEGFVAGRRVAAFGEEEVGWFEEGSDEGDYFSDSEDEDDYF